MVTDNCKKGNGERKIFFKIQIKKSSPTYLQEKTGGVYKKRRRPSGGRSLSGYRKWYSSYLPL